MSGGRFDIKQWQIDNIADQIEHEVIKSGKPIPRRKMSDVSVTKDKKGSAFVVSHKRVSITECIYLTYEELKELKTLLKGVVP